MVRPPEHAEAGQVDRGGEQGEVGADLDLAAGPGPAARRADGASGGR